MRDPRAGTMPTTRQAIWVNGKFTAQPTTGVQRVAGELLCAVDRLLPESGRARPWVLLCPPGAHPPPLKHITVRTIGSRLGGLHFWEQALLPAYSAGQLLLNLSGPAPLLKRRQVCMIPDAALFDCPGTYQFGFRLFYRTVFRVVAQTAPLLLTLSEYSRQRLSQHLGASLAHACVTYAGSEHLQPLPDDQALVAHLRLTDHPYLLAVASQSPAKNVGRLIEAFHGMAHPSARLLLVGRLLPGVFSPMQPSPDRSGGIVQLGAVTDRQLATLYRHALGFVCPSLYEGLGLPPLEAMALGCPVAVSREAALPEICGNGAAYFDPRSTDDIRCILEMLLADVELRDTLRRNGRLVAARFTWERSARRLLGALEAAGLW